MTLPSSFRRNVTVDEQLRHNQKYSVIVVLDDLTVESQSRRKSRPSLKYLNEAEHEGLLHLATIPAPVASEEQLQFAPFLERYGDGGHPSV